MHVLRCDRCTWQYALSDTQVRESVFDPVSFYLRQHNRIPGHTAHRLVEEWA